MKSFDWSKVAFGSKDKISDLHATFIAAPRELSTARFTQLVRENLPKGHIVLGMAKEDFIAGFEGQAQFKTLHQSDIQSIIDKVEASSSKYKIYPFHYFQRELKFILKELRFSRAVFVNGSWKYSFHTRPEFYTLIQRGINYSLVSPFADEQEALRYAELFGSKPEQHIDQDKVFTAEQLLQYASEAAQMSFDTSYQVGAVIGKPIDGSTDEYSFVLQSHNKVVPYQTYAMHFGASREKNFSPPYDQNHHDTIHAEALAIVTAQQQHVSLTGATLFVNLLPCPACTRILCATDIAEIIYSVDHSEGYAIAMLQKSGKKITRLVNQTGV